MKKKLGALIAGVFITGISTSAVLCSDVQMNIPKSKEFRIERSMPPEAMACIECHKKQHPGIFSD